MAHPPDYSLEDTIRTGPVCGVDEVGRGPLAGPIMAAAAIVDPDTLPEGVADSKTLSKKRREELNDALRACATVALGEASAQEIDELGLTRANDLAMARAIAALPERPVFALIDGRRLPPALPCPGQAVIRGDAKSLSIAAASIVAKVARDRVMETLATTHPGYGWERNSGYGTAEHLSAIHKLGITSHHRKRFRPISEILP